MQAAIRSIIATLLLTAWARLRIALGRDGRRSVSSRGRCSL
jgi:hypothetical protein